MFVLSYAYVIIFISAVIQETQLVQLKISNSSFDQCYKRINGYSSDYNDINYVDLSSILVKNDSSSEEREVSEITTTPSIILTTLQNLEYNDEIMKCDSSISSSSEQSSSSSSYYDYEDIESSCQMRRYSIQPKALNNIFNIHTRIVNNESFVQSINIEQCLSKTEPCNIGSIPPCNKQKYVCRQKYVQIRLKAYENFTNKIVDEEFYYPSHCVCELVKIKRKKLKHHNIHKKNRIQCTLEELYKFYIH